jgi:aryl-alcohol dehydrogenase-like predicted oxidoreductase
MQYRALGRTGWKVSTISFGAWAIGGAWGSVDDSESIAALHRALDLGVNLFDTADVYGDGHSERLLARLRRERPDMPFRIATNAGDGVRSLRVASVTGSGLSESHRCVQSKTDKAGVRPGQAWYLWCALDPT